MTATGVPRRSHHLCENDTRFASSTGRGMQEGFSNVTDPIPLDRAGPEFVIDRLHAITINGFRWRPFDTLSNRPDLLENVAARLSVPRDR